MITADINKAASVLDAVSQALSGEQLQTQIGGDYVHFVLDYIASGQSFTPRSGTLQRSIGFKEDGGRVSVLAAADYATAIEFGTKHANAFPFIYADMENRKAELAESVKTFIDTTITGAQ
jgi:hypothetical protein